MLRRVARHRPADSTGRVRLRDLGWYRSVPLLLDPGGLADPITEVVELGSAHVTAAQNFDLLDDVCKVVVYLNTNLPHG